MERGRERERERESIGPSVFLDIPVTSSAVLLSMQRASAVISSVFCIRRHYHAAAPFNVGLVRLSSSGCGGCATCCCGRRLKS